MNETAVTSLFPLYGILPDPSEGELLFSVAARYHVLSGHYAWMATRRDLVGSDKGFSRAVFPNGIARIAAHYSPASSVKGALDLAFKTTPLRYYIRFNNPQEAELKAQRLLEPKGAVRAAAQFGFKRSPTAHLPDLRYCPRCVQDGLKGVGYSIWKIVDQLPLVGMCLKHEEPLVNGCAACSPVMKVSSLFLPSDLACTCSSPAPKYGVDPLIVNRKAHLSFCQISYEICTRQDLPSGDILLGQIWSGVQDRYATKKTTRWVELSRRLVEEFGEAHVSSVCRGDASLNAVTKTLRAAFAKGRSQAPVPLLVSVIHLLFGGVDALVRFKSKPADTAPVSFAKSPAPLSKKVPAIAPEVDLGALLLAHRGHATPVARALGVSNHSVALEAFKRGLDKSLKIVVERDAIEANHKKVRKLMLEGVNAKQIGERLGLSAIAVAFSMARHHKVTMELRELRLAKGRKEILAALEGGIETRVELQNRHRHACTYARKYDREWLESILPDRRVLQEVGFRSQAKLRDDEDLKKRVIGAADQLRRRERPVWISRQLLLREAKIPATTYETHKSLLPRTAAAIKANLDTKEAIAVRRLEKALDREPPGVTPISATWLKEAGVISREPRLMGQLRAACVARGVDFTF